MSAQRKPIARDFPILWTMRAARKHFPRRVWVTCSVCHLAIDPRNRQRHVKACMRRKRLAPELWAEWVTDMRREG